MHAVLFLTKIEMLVKVRSIKFVRVAQFREDKRTDMTRLEVSFRDWYYKSANKVRIKDKY